MTPQDGRGSFWSDLSFEARLNGLSLALVGNHRQDFFCLQNLLGRHRDGLLGNLRDVGEPGFPYLLLATSFIEVDDQVRILGIEVRWWIVEGNVPVFADAQECNIDRDRC